MTNTKSEIKIIEGFANDILIIKESAKVSEGIGETKEENTIYNASLIYEF